VELTLGDEISKYGWRSGSVIPNEMIGEFICHLVRPGKTSADVSVDDWVVVVSQTCDVVALKLEAEPFVEILHCKPVPKLRQQYKELRSTRILDFKPNRETHDSIVLSAHAVADRYFIPRELLRAIVPDATRRLSRVATIRVMEWLALRYTRPAWPDDFVFRISPLKDELEAALEPLSDDIAQVRVGIYKVDRELIEDESYSVSVYFVVDEEVWEADVEGRSKIYAAFAKFVTTLNCCKGIEVNEELSDVYSGANFTWQQMELTELWNFANLTHRE
jgi:hypothetical protein